MIALNSSGWIVRNNTIMNFDARFAPEVNPLRVFWIIAGDDSAISDIDVRNNNFCNQLTGAGIQSPASDKIRMFDLTGERPENAGGVLDRIAIVANVGRNLCCGLAVGLSVSVTNLSDIDNDFRNDVAPDPTVSTTNVVSFRNQRNLKRSTEEVP